jgi:precorrin-3B methylase
MQKDKKNADKIVHEEKYVAFLKKRLESENFKENVSSEEFQKTKEKYDKAKFKLKMLKESMK